MLTVRGGYLFVTQKSRHALRLLVTLARLGPGVSRSGPSLAAQELISTKYFEKIAAELRLAGLIETSRGQKGGYSLTAAASVMTLGELLPLLQADGEPLPCLVDGPETLIRCADCALGDNCTVRVLYAELQSRMAKILGRLTLNDLARSSADLEQFFRSTALP